MKTKVWAVVDATHPDAWTPAERTVSADIAKETYHRMFRELNASVESFASPDARFAAVLEQGRPWWSDLPSIPPTERRFELPFDRGTGPAFLLALLTLTHRAPGGAIMFVSGRHGWPSTIERERIPGSSRADGKPSIWVYSHAGHDWRNGAIAVAGRIETFLEAFRLVQPAMVHTFLASWRRTGGERHELIEETYPYLHEVDLFRDVLAPAVDMAPVFASSVRHRELTAA